MTELALRRADRRHQPLGQPARTTPTPTGRGRPAALDQACTNVGFVQILGHGIPEPVIDGLKWAVDAFFGQELEVKKRYVMDGANRGYTPPKSESLSLSLGVEKNISRMNDFFEAFNVGEEARGFPELNLSEEDYGINVWPEGIDGWRDAVEAYFGEARRVAHTMTTIFEAGLGSQGPASSSGSPTTRSMCCDSTTTRCRRAPLLPTAT